MLNLSVIAKPYAKAAFEFAYENNLLEQWSKSLKLFANIFKDNSVKDIISSHVCSQIEIINDFKNKLDEGFFNFLNVLAENKKLIFLSEISKEFEYIKNIQNNIKIADVTLAYVTNDNLLSSLKESLEKKFGCFLDFKVSVDPSIVGGVIVKVGDIVIDNSVSGSLKKLKSSLLS